MLLDKYQMVEFSFLHHDSIGELRICLGRVDGKATRCQRVTECFEGQTHRQATVIEVFLLPVATGTERCEGQKGH